MNYFIPPSLYFKLLTAYRNGSVKISNDYQHLDWIDEDKLLKCQNSTIELDSDYYVDHFRTKRGDTYALTTVGKTLFFRVTWGLSIAAFSLVGALIGWAISCFA